MQRPVDRRRRGRDPQGRTLRTATAHTTADDPDGTGDHRPVCLRGADDRALDIHTSVGDGAQLGHTSGLHAGPGHSAREPVARVTRSTGGSRRELSGCPPRDQAWRRAVTCGIQLVNRLLVAYRLGLAPWQRCCPRTCQPAPRPRNADLLPRHAPDRLRAYWVFWPLLSPPYSSSHRSWPPRSARRRPTRLRPPLLPGPHVTTLTNLEDSSSTSTGTAR